MLPVPGLAAYSCRTSSWPRRQHLQPRPTRVTLPRDKYVISRYAPYSPPLKHLPTPPVLRSHQPLLLWPRNAMAPYSLAGPARVLAYLVPLHPLRGDLQRAHPRHRRRPSPLEGLPAAAPMEDHGAAGRRVHPRHPAAHPATRIPPHWPFRASLSVPTATPRPPRPLPTPAGHAPADSPSEPQPTDYRDRWEALAGQSLQLCPTCGGGTMLVVEVIRPGHDPPPLQDNS